MGLRSEHGVSLQIAGNYRVSEPSLDDGRRRARYFPSDAFDEAVAYRRELEDSGLFLSPARRPIEQCGAVRREIIRREHYEWPRWVASIRIDGRALVATFGCTKYGEDVAQEMAEVTLESWREELKRDLRRDARRRARNPRIRVD